MAPSILNFRALRRRSKASFKTDRSNTDVSSDASQGTTPTLTSGASTPPSLAQASDPALDLQVKDAPSQPIPRPPLQPVNNSHRHSVSGMAGLGSPVNGKSTLPVSQYAPRIANISENAWVSEPNSLHSTCPRRCVPPRSRQCSPSDRMAYRTASLSPTDGRSHSKQFSAARALG